MPEHVLIPHPTTPCPAVRSLTASADRVSDDLLVIRYEVEGDIDELLLPAQACSQHADALWKSTCFEAFLRAPGSEAYVELNFSPSSEWAVYRFDGYRRGMAAIDAEPPPRIVCRRRETTLAADVDVHLQALGDACKGDLDIALSAVVKDRRGVISYWALVHPPGKPDFHHADGVVVHVAAGDSH